jgi:transcriptional regulator with XRE-family HTH domain
MIRITSNLPNHALPLTALATFIYKHTLGHFLGRFRRANVLSHKAVAEHLGIHVDWVRDWESPSRRRNPTSLQLIALSKMTDVDLKLLTQMLPPEPLHLETRLCPSCYAEVPVHRSQWQSATTNHCGLHSMPLLSACSGCGAGFRTPALWESDCCEQCGLAFAQM